MTNRELINVLQKHHPLTKIVTKVRDKKCGYLPIQAFTYPYPYGVPVHEAKEWAIHNYNHDGLRVGEVIKALKNSCDLDEEIFIGQPKNTRSIREIEVRKNTRELAIYPMGRILSNERTL